MGNVTPTLRGTGDMARTANPAGTASAAPAASGEAQADQARRQRYWRHNLRLTGALAALWFFVTFVLVYFSRELSFKVVGWPFSFWVAGQGALVVYCLIIWFYARRMNQLDAQFAGAAPRPPD